MKFINLLKKELSELITAQMLATLGILVMVFVLMGNVMKSAVNEVVEDVSHPKVNICDLDDTELTNSITDAIKTAGAELKLVSGITDDYAKALNDNDIKSLVIIPEGFTESVEKGERPQLISISKMTSAATFSNLTSDTSGATSLIEKCIANIVSQKLGITPEKLDLIETPVELEDNTVVADKYAKVSISAVMSKVSVQNMLLPIALFFLILQTSSALITSISNEKIDKTLETLLSAPVSRMSIITAKMLAAAIVALINAAVMMGCFMFTMKDMTADLTADLSEVVGETLSVDDALSVLGLNLSAGQYVLVGVQFFVTIMICLSISILLGSMVSDAKSAQTATLPIMAVVMVPYVITMLTDVNSLPMVARILVYAIPFTHTFTSMSNLMFGNTAVFFAGLAYQVVVLAIFLVIAVRLFKSDKILTMSKTWSKRKKGKNAPAED